MSAAIFFSCPETFEGCFRALPGRCDCSNCNIADIKNNKQRLVSVQLQNNAKIRTLQNKTYEIQEGAI